MTHIPVLLDESVNGLSVSSDSWYVDATLGAGGHTLEILKRGGKVLAVDQDPKAISRARLNIKQHLGLSTSKEEVDEVMNSRLLLKTGNFSNLDILVKQENIDNIRGVLFDLGFSTDQMNDSSYGLSFQTDGPLDMRLDPDLGVTAADLVNSLSKKQLTDLFKQYGDEPRAKKIAGLILDRRKRDLLRTTDDLASIAIEAYKGSSLKIHPATKIFQALRIVVNDEVNSLNLGLGHAADLLIREGRLVVISFHSGEDRLVKRFMHDASNKIEMLNKKPIVPGSYELGLNPRARSAKLRIGRKI